MRVSANLPHWTHGLKCGQAMKGNDQISEQLLSRAQLRKRWSCSGETIKRRTKEGVLYPLKFNQRFLRYRLGDIVRVEQQATGGEL